MLGVGWRRRHAPSGTDGPRTAAHLAAPGLCIDKATRNALHGSGSGSSAAAASARSMWLDGSLGLGRAGASLAAPSAKKLGRRRWALGVRKKPYGKKWLWPAQDPQETHRHRSPSVLTS
jgi:hypothetical protein